MSSWLDLDDDTIDLAEAISRHLGCARGRVVKMALALLAIDLGIKLELPRKEKEDAG